MTAREDGQALRQELDRVLSSTTFARNERVSKLLRFLVERFLEGRENELKETSIGVEVFGRRADYDPKLDSTVRTEATRLRARLDRYYSTEGIQNPCIIQLPKGGYTPSFRRPEPAAVVEESSHKRRWIVAALAGFGAVLIALAGWWAVHRGDSIPIAVLPLVNLSPDPANSYLADGLTSEIIGELSIIEGLSVRSQTSSFALKGKSLNLHEASSQLGADYILEGSVVRAGDLLRIDTRLIRTRDELPIWSGKFERPWTDVLSIQEQISRGIVNSLRLKLGQGRRRYETSVEAWDLYLRARALATQGFPGDAAVIKQFEKALALDSSLAPAWAGLAGAYAYQSSQRPNASDHDDKLSKMRAAAEKAIELDPLLAEAHSALGTAYARNGQWDQAEVSLRRAIQISPSLSTGHENLTRFFLFPLGRIEEAIREARAEVKLDPLSPNAHYLLAQTLISAGLYEEAAGQCEKLPSDYSLLSDCRGRAWLGQGKTAEAIRVLASADDWGYLAYAYGRKGSRDEVEKLSTEAPLAHPNRRGHFQFALVYAGLKDKDRTINELEQWAGVGPVRMGFTLTGPEFAFVRGDPRVTALRKRVGLPN